MRPSLTDGSRPRGARSKAVLAYLSRYTHRVAISNTRLIAHDSRGVTFRYKDYSADGHARHKAMTLAAEEFIRRFLLHILPKGFHRIRHYGLFANTGRAISRPAPISVAAPSIEWASFWEGCFMSFPIEFRWDDLNKKMKRKDRPFLFRSR